MSTYTLGERVEVCMPSKPTTSITGTVVEVVVKFDNEQNEYHGIHWLNNGVTTYKYGVISSGKLITENDCKIAVTKLKKD